MLPANSRPLKTFSATSVGFMREFPRCMEIFPPLRCMYEESRDFCVVIINLINKYHRKFFIRNKIDTCRAAGIFENVSNSIGTGKLFRSAKTFPNKL